MLSLDSVPVKAESSAASATVVITLLLRSHPQDVRVCTFALPLERFDQIYMDVT